MRHDILGEIEQPEDRTFDAIATIQHDSRQIKFQIDRHDQPLEAALKFAAEVAIRLAELDKHAKQIAAKELLETYNDGWNSYDEVQDDGSLKEVVNPELSNAEFEARLSLCEVYIEGNRIVEFTYDNDDMFWGHDVAVLSRDGMNFTNTEVQLHG
jgi:hypothetical protein